MGSPRILLRTLSVRTSGKGNAYLSRCGQAFEAVFAGEPDKHGNPTWDAPGRPWRCRCGPGLPLLPFWCVLSRRCSCTMPGASAST